MNLTSIKSFVLDHALVGAVYRSGSRVRAAVYAALGRRWDAVSAQLRALRSTSVAQHSEETMTRVREWQDWGCRGAGGALLALRQNKWLEAFLNTPEAHALRLHFAKCSLEHRVRMREPNDEDSQRQGNLLVLKAYHPATGEKGALLLNYTLALRRFPAMFDIAELASRYTFVLEPSSWGYEDPGLFLYAGSDVDVVVQAPWKRDYEFLVGLRSNLTPVRFGAGDWVDPATFFSDKPPKERRFDVVVVSAWSALKRHKDLFRAAAGLKKQGKLLQIALIGYPLDWTRATIEQLAREFGIEEQCTIHDSVPQSVVAQIVGDSRSYVLMSRREGANRALYEALFCDTPVVVYAGHRGVNTDLVRQGVGVLFEPEALTAAIEQILNHGEEYKPRAWAESHTGYRNTTAALNDVLRTLSKRRGLPWTTDIVAKKNAPELRYADPEDVHRFVGEYRELSRFLR